MKTPKEMELAILEALQQTHHPMKGLIELVLQRWELEIRKDQAELNYRQNIKLLEEYTSDIINQHNQ